MQWTEMDKTAWAGGQMELIGAADIPLPADFGADKSGTPDMFADLEA